jgi:hypothetical protein
MQEIQPQLLRDDILPTAFMDTAYFRSVAIAVWCLMLGALSFGVWRAMATGTLIQSLNEHMDRQDAELTILRQNQEKGFARYNELMDSQNRILSRIDQGGLTRP